MDNPSCSYPVLCLLLVWISIVYGTRDCYNHITRSYDGNISSPIPSDHREYECMTWDEVRNNKDISFKLDPLVDYKENYCRFILGMSVPSCFTADGHETPYAVMCYVFSCDAHTGCMNDDGADYRDGAVFTESGYTCMDWSESFNLSVNPSIYPEADLTSNFCRNPDGSERPWCYYRDEEDNVNKGFCMIRQCRLTALHTFKRRALTTLDYHRSPHQYARDVESAEACADWCIRETQFKCASFLFQDFTKHVTMTPHENCVWANVSIYTLDVYDDDMYDPYWDLFTRMDTLCDYYLVDTYPDLCPLPLGLETGMIEDYQLNASSWVDGHPSHHARLNGNSSWVPHPDDPDPFIQIRFEERMIITGLVVQGGGGSRAQSWMERFTLSYSYSFDGSWHPYRLHDDDADYAEDTVFRANGEPNCPKAVYFNPPIRANFLEIKIWREPLGDSHTKRPRLRQVALRAEILGCRDNDCDYTLGLTNGQSHDSQITASTSVSNAVYSPSHGRLQPSYGKQGTGWKPSFLSSSQYLQVDFLEDMMIKAVVTQGCGDSESRVRAFTMSWSRGKEGNFHWIRSGHFKTKFLDKGNRVLYRNNLEIPLIARKVRIYPIDWDDYICMRVEFIGCKNQVCVDRLGMERGDILDSQISQVSQKSPFMEGRFARLYGDRCWMPQQWSSHHFIQIDFNGLHTITGVIAQGGRAEDGPNSQEASWADSFRLLYRSRKDREKWKVYKDLRGRAIEFTTYPDPDTETRHSLDRPVMTDGIRINPKANLQNYCLRLEFLGCDVREKGYICEDKNTEHDGYCLRSVETQESNGCEEIFMEGSHSAVIQSTKLQKFFEKEKERFQLPYIYQYTIGLQKMASHHQSSFLWLPDKARLPMTYENFRWLPESIANNNTIDTCVYLDFDDSMKWRAFLCRDTIVSRGTICQIDIDECLREQDSPCSHRCVNVAGSYHCACPPGFYLTSLDGTICRRLDSPHITLLPPSMDYEGSIYDLNDYDYESSEVLDGTQFINISSPPLIEHTAMISTINATDLNQLNSNISDEVFSRISGQRAADVRCEVLWKNFSFPITRTEKQEGIIQGISFPPWYNTGQWCEIRITAPDGYFIKFTFQELRLRKSKSSANCQDVLNITDHFPKEGKRLRGSYCGDHQQMVVTSRSSNVTLKLSMGDLEADMPKKLGFIATYETKNCIGNGDGCEPGCGGPDVFRDLNGSFSINSVDSSLAPFSFCNWTISVPEGNYVALNFTEFDIGRDPTTGTCTDSVEVIFTGKGGTDEKSQILCGDVTPYILTSSSEVKLVFQTGLEVRSLGFRVNYESKGVPGCGIGTHSGNEPLFCTDASAFVASINFPHHYLPNQNSTWHIRTEVGTFVQLVFRHFNVAESPDCRADHVKIYEKEYESRRFCNSDLPPSPVRSSFNTLILAFVSDYANEASGFLAVYRTARYQRKIRTPSSPSKTEEPVCQPDWVPFESHCYTFITATLDSRWTDAQRDCEEEGAFLVSINSIREMEFVHATLTSTWFTNNTKTYIGLQLDRTRGVHMWRDQSPMSYSDWSVPTHQGNWKMRQPNGGSMEECSLIELTNLHSTNHWHDVPCASTDTSQFICEKPAQASDPGSHLTKTVKSMVTGACPKSMTFINNQCIGINHIRAPSNDALLQNKTCQSGLSFLRGPVTSSLEYYMNHVISYRGELPVLVDVSHHANGTVCRVLAIEGRLWKMRERLCAKDLKLGGAICAASPVEQEQRCSSNLFQCSSEECVQKVQVCDGTKDCADGSDEEECAKETLKSEFYQCGSGEALQISFFCDHNPQCLDGSDENDCDYPTCSSDQFTCLNGQCIQMAKRCDLIPHCVDGSDESDCESSDVGFQCYDGHWIPWRAYCDGVKDCQGNSWEDEPQLCRPDPTRPCEPHQVQCGSGACEDRSSLCLYDFDRYGYQVGCRDVAHLRHCDLFECSNFTFKCPRSYCIPLHRRCDGRFDCPSGEDESGCDNYTCPKGSYRCNDARHCLTQDLVCDGVKQCPSGDDEWLCGMECPADCLCTGLSYTCDVITSSFIFNIPSVVRRLNLSDIVSSSTYHIVKRRSLPSSNFTIHDTELLNQLHRFTMLTELDLSRSGLRAIKPNQFQYQVNLHSLYLSHNNIHSLLSNSFAGLQKLTRLDLSGNPISAIEPKAFLYLNRLPDLNLNGLLLEEIFPGMFTGLSSLRNLSLTNNPIKKIETGSFTGLNISFLNVSHIGEMDSLPSFELDVFEGMDNLSVLAASNFVFCCLISDKLTCVAPQEQFSSCKDLMRYSFLRVCMWLLGLSALLGNTFVLVWRWRTRQRESSKRVQTFLISNLAVADFLMGVYMITIAGADLFYRDHYMIHADEWKRSFLCQMSGLLSVLSSEASVFLLVLITIDRFLGVVFPFSVLRFHTKSVRVVVACAWVLALFLSTLPLLITQTPEEQFYGRSSVCLALPLTSDRPPGWTYSLILFVGVNFACFILIFVCYFIMFVAIRKASRQSTRRREVSEEVKMATKMALIVGTDLFCWMPIIIMGLLSWSGVVQIPQDIYAVVAVFILPVNSAANPYLYTISTLDRSCEKTFRRGSMASPTPSSWKSDCTRDLSLNEMELVKVLRTNSIQPPIQNDKHMNGIMPAIIADLSESHLLPILTFRCRNILLSRLIERSDWHLKESDVTTIESDLKKALDMLHRCGFLHGNVNEDHVVIDQTSNSNRTGAYLIMRGGEIETAEDAFGASDNSSEDERSEGSTYDNHPTTLVDQDERVSMIRRDWQQLKTLVQRLKTLC